jgi:Ca2+/Na+ antiporter
MLQENLINLLFVVGLIGVILYFKFLRDSKLKKEINSNEFKKVYLDVLNSDEYKVKGKYE